MAQKRVKILIRKGTVTTLYDDELAHALQEELGAKAEVKRVSHVEPIPGEREEILFEADLAPVNGPKLSGFKTYKEAVAAEIAWLEEHFLTTSKEQANIH